MKCTDLLIQEHKVILRALDVLSHMADRVEHDQPVETQDVQTLLRFLRAFADSNHQLKEESALFPELMKASANQPGLHQMIFEHDQERSLVEGLEDALYTKQGAEFVIFADRLIGLIRNHIRKEDTILFDLVERSLSAEQDDRVTEELEKFDVDPVLLADLRKLEWAYLRRSACA
jgi:hemerythrin-like domain-containing protein